MARSSGLSVRDHRELTAVVLAFTRLETDVKRQVNAATRQTLNPIWTSEINSRVRTPMDAKVIAKGAKVKAGNPPVLQAATSTRAIGKRLVPADTWQPWEFGSPPEKVTTYTRKSKKGGTHKVTRHTSRQLPPVTPKGRVAYPSVGAAVPRIASLWVQTVVRCVHEAAEAR